MAVNDTLLLEEFDGDVDDVVEQIKSCVRRDGYFAPHPDVLGVHDLNGACAPLSLGARQSGIVLPASPSRWYGMDYLLVLREARDAPQPSQPPPELPASLPPNRLPVERVERSSLCYLPPIRSSDNTITLTGHWTNGRHVIYRADSPKNAVRTGYWYIGT